MKGITEETPRSNVMTINDPFSDGPSRVSEEYKWGRESTELHGHHWTLAGLTSREPRGHVVYGVRWGLRGEGPVWEGHSGGARLSRWVCPSNVAQPPLGIL